MSKKICDIKRIDHPTDQATEKPSKKRQYHFNTSNSSANKVSDFRTKPSPLRHFLKRYQSKSPQKIFDFIKLATFGVFIIFVINLFSVHADSLKIKDQLINQAKEGLDSLIFATQQSGNIGYQNAIKNFNQAQELFQQAEDSLWFIGNDQSIYQQDSDISYTISNIISAAQDFTAAGQNLFLAVEEFNRIPIYFVIHNNRPNARTPSLSGIINRGLQSTELAITQISLASDKLKEVNITLLPETFQERFYTLQNYLNQTTQTLKDLRQQFPSLLRLLGDRHPHRFMVLFQNNFELRPTGGFIGSYATFDLNDGYIENLEVHDVYDLDGSFGGQINPPEVMGDFTNNLRFRDSNYSPDFPTSAEKILWIYEQQGGESIDTLIAINQGLLKDMLQITGPIQVGDFGEFNADNYNLLLSYIIEGKIWGNENPKHILKVFVPNFKDAILKEQNLRLIIPKIYSAIQQKHIFVYSKHTQIKNLISYLSLDGTLRRPQPDEDFLSVIHTGIGTKTDQFIEETINHLTEISQNGEVINTLTIHRHHQWNTDIYWQWERELRKYGLSFSKVPPDILSILGSGTNTAYSRIYIPKNSEIITSNTDPEIELLYDQELDLAYVRAKISVDPGQTSTFQLIYKPNLKSSLNAKSYLDYKIYIAKQPGTRGSLLNKTILPPKNSKLIRYHPSTLNTTSTGATKTNTNLVYDRYFSVIFEK